jgi:pimeloyl-ACP methyl ester carboxylesterase
MLRRILTGAVGLWLWLLAGSLALAGPPAQSDLPQGTAAFEAGECTFDSPLPRFLEQNVACGFVTVPVRHADPSGPSLRLSVAIYKSTGPDPAPDPLFLAQGGPGGSTIDGFHLLMLNSQLRQERDIVLFDQRGTLYTEPNLICSELIAAIPEILPLEREEAEARSQAALRACHQRFRAERIDLSAFNSLENAADVEAVRLALGYETINFYGVSYGTLLGLHLMRHHPQHLRSVILDSVVPPQTNFLTEVPASTERVFAQFFATCQADPACQARYPELETQLFDLVDRLNETPLRLTLTDPETGQQTQARFAGDDLLDLIYQIFYIPQGYAVTPKVVELVAGGDTTFIEQIWPLIIFDRTFSQGMYFSVICAEDADFSPANLVLSGVRPRFAETAAADAQEILDICAYWNVTPLPASVDAPVMSQIPTLLLAGQFDPITPPSFAATAAETLAHSYLVVVEHGSHGVAVGTDECVDEIMAQFLNDPGQHPDTLCLARTEPLTFVTEEIVSLPMIGRINRLDDGVLQEIGLAALFLGGVLSAGPLWLIVFVIRLFRANAAQPGPTHRGLRWTIRALILLFGGLASLFVTGLTALIVNLLLADTNLAILSAVPAWSAPLFLIPPLLLLLALGLTLAVAWQWLGEGGSLWGRIYHTFLAGCALAYVAVLTASGLLTVWL